MEDGGVAEPWWVTTRWVIEVGLEAANLRDVVTSGNGGATEVS